MHLSQLYHLSRTHQPILAYPLTLKGSHLTPSPPCDTRRLQIMSIPSEGPYLRNTIFSVIYHPTLSFHFQFCQNTLQTSFLLQNLPKKGGRKLISTHWFSYGQKKKIWFFS